MSSWESTAASSVLASDSSMSRRALRFSASSLPAFIGGTFRGGFERVPIFRASRRGRRGRRPSGPRCRSRRRRGPFRTQCLPCLYSPTAPGRGTWPRWPPWPVATRTHSRRTSRSSASGPRRSRCAPASSPARAGASCCRWRSGGRGRGGRRPSRSPRGRGPWPPGSCAGP